MGRQGMTTSIKYPEVGSFPMHWAIARSGSTIIQVAYRPGSLLPLHEGRARVVELAATSVAKAED